MTAFGNRVIGDDAYQKALAEKKAGADVFGKRVVGEVDTSGTAEELAKGNSQFGPLVVMDAKAADHTGKKGATVAVEDLENILTENPTFFDSLFENELAREGGPRKEALEVFIVVEEGPKGADREWVTRKINGLLGKTAEIAKSQAEEAGEVIRRRRDMEQRGKENIALQDADRIRSLREREDDLKEIRKSNPELLKQQNVETTAGESGGRTSVATGDTTPNSRKAEDDVKPETQQRTKRSSQKKGK